MLSKSEDAALRRLHWAARRGMLELDLLLEPFIAGCFSSLSSAEQADLERLLRCQDQDLYAWLLGRAPAPDPALQDLVAAIVTFARSQR
jgi:antitoxin CptB